MVCDPSVQWSMKAHIKVTKLTFPPLHKLRGLHRRGVTSTLDRRCYFKVRSTSLIMLTSPLAMFGIALSSPVHFYVIMRGVSPHQFLTHPGNHLATPFTIYYVFTKLLPYLPLQDHGMASRFTVCCSRPSSPSLSHLTSLYFTTYPSLSFHLY